MNDAAQALTDQFRLTVDYGQSFQQMIATGHYDWTNGDITAERFPMQGTGTVQVEARLFHFGHDISSEDAVEAIKTTDAKHPWAPAAIEYLLSFGATHPEQQRKYLIVAPGSVAEVGGRRLVPYLDVSDRKRSLRLPWWDGDWHGCDRFLAVRSRSSGT